MTASRWGRMRLRGLFHSFKALQKTLCAALRMVTSLEAFYRQGAKILVRVLYRAEFRGFEKIPATGPALLIANHITYMDGLILHAACKRPIVFLIDEDVYRIPFVKYFMDMNGAVPILPNRESVSKALAEISHRLKNGEVVGVFPEGMLTYTGNMARFKFGIEWMVQNDPVPVYPIALKGLWGSIFSRKYRRSRFRYFPRSFRRKVTAVCGDPIPPEKAKISYLQRRIMDLKNSA